jgi:hypothetical protein
MGEDANLRALLMTLDPKARVDLRRVLIRGFETLDRICKLYGWPQTFVAT